MSEKPQVIRSLWPRFGVRRAPLRGVAEIVLGHPLGGRDSLAMRGIAERQARGAAQEAAKHQTTQDASLQAEKGARKAAVGRPRSNANASEPAESAEADLEQERARSRELEKQLSIRQNDLKLVAQERARNQELEKQLAARASEQDLLAQERARSQELEKQLSLRQNDLKLVAQERARNRELEKRLAARAKERDLLAQERARTQELEKQLSVRQNVVKLASPDTPGGFEAEPRPAEASLPLERKPPWQHKSKILVPSGVLLFLVAGAAGYAAFHTHSPDPVVSQTAAAAIAPAVLSIAPVAAEVSARAAEEASRREAAAQRQAEEQRLADMKAAEEGARRSAEPGEADLRLTPRDRQKLQVALSSLGFDVGAIDGAFGPRTRKMIGAWQIKSGNISTGFFTAAQKNSLLSESAPAIAKWEDGQKRANAEEQRRAAEEQKRAAEEEQQRLQQQEAPPSERQSGFKWPWQ